MPGMVAHRHLSSELRGKVRNVEVKAKLSYTVKHCVKENTLNSVPAFCCDIIIMLLLFAG